MKSKDIFEEGYKAGLAVAYWNTVSSRDTDPDDFTSAWAGSRTKEQEPPETKVNPGWLPGELVGKGPGEYEILIGGLWICPTHFRADEWDWHIDQGEDQGISSMRILLYRLK